MAIVNFLSVFFLKCNPDTYESVFSHPKRSKTKFDSITVIHYFSQCALSPKKICQLNFNLGYKVLFLTSPTGFKS